MKISLAVWKRVPISTLILLTIFVALIVVALVIGIDSDRGVLVGWLGVIVLLTEITRRWRKEWQFLLLILGSVLGAIILSGLHELIVGSDSIVQNYWLNFLHALITDSILLFVPMAIIYGLLATITIFIVRMATLRRKKAPEKT